MQQRLLRQRGLGIAGILGLAAALGATGFFPHLGWKQLRGIVAVQPITVLAAVLIALRLHLLSGGSVGVWPAFKGTALSGTLLYALPSRMSEFIKPVYFSHKCGIDLIKGIAIVAIERFIDVVIVALATVIAALLLANRDLDKAPYLWGGVALVGVAGLLVVRRWPGIFATMLAILPSKPLRSMLERLMGEVRTAIAAPRMNGALAAGMAAWIASFAMAHTLLNLVGSKPLTPMSTLVVFLAGSLGLAAAVAPGGLGTFEAGTVVALKLLGFEMTEALGLALCLRLANLGVMPLVAAWTMVMDGLGLQRLVTQVRQLRGGGRS